MKNLENVAMLAAKIAARIEEFRAARGLSFAELTRAASMTSEEITTIREGRTEITTDLLTRIAKVLNVHPAVLLMCPDEDPMAQLLEQYRDLPRDEFQRIAADFVVRGYRGTRGSA